MPAGDRDDLIGGHYARKQLFSRSRVVAWSHGRRFELARTLVAPRAGRTLLDYGCGDGTFLALVRDLYPSAVGVDPDPHQVADCRRRLASSGGLSFATIDRLADPSFDSHFDVVTCMEVLEHCPDDLQQDALAEIHRVAASGALVVISVPIEIGPSLLMKQAVRAVAAWRGLREYEGRERYAVGELLRMMTARAGTAIGRDETVAEFESGRRMRFTGHKGFNWRTLERRLATVFGIEARLFSPMPLMGPWLNSQAWFVCRKR